MPASGWEPGEILNYPPPAEAAAADTTFGTLVGGKAPGAAGQKEAEAVAAVYSNLTAI